jgi:hypothetical protein
VHDATTVSALLIVWLAGLSKCKPACRLQLADDHAAVRRGSREFSDDARIWLGACRRLNS